MALNTKLTAGAVVAILIAVGIKAYFKYERSDEKRELDKMERESAEDNAARMKRMEEMRARLSTIKTGLAACDTLTALRAKTITCKRSGAAAKLTAFMNDAQMDALNAKSAADLETRCQATLDRVVAAFREGGGEGKPVRLQVHLSWAATDEEALRIAHDQWRTNVFAPPLCWDLQTVEQFDEAAKHVRPEDVRASVLVSADTGRHVAALQELAPLGFDQIVLHHVGQDLRPFIDAFGERVLPELAA